MIRRSLVLLPLLALLAVPLAAFERGHVYIETDTTDTRNGENGSDLWVHVGAPYAVNANVWLLIDKLIPYYAVGGHFLIPTPNLVVFHGYHHNVSWWDGVLRKYWEPGNGYTDIFFADTELGEIAPLRNGNFLVAERFNDAARGAKLIEFNLQGKVAEYALPEVLDAENHRALGALHIEVLADGCSVLYTLGNDTPDNNRVRRYNICTRQAEPDFASLVAGQYAGAIRQLPNGDVLVANGTAVLQFTSSGSLLRSYQLPGVTHIALTPDGRMFFAAGVELDQAKLVRFDPSVPNGDPKTIRVGNPGFESSDVPVDIWNLVTVGEWRASAPVVAGRARPIRRP